ncbi:sulfotransferase 1C2-like [Haemaphysalis longicornis]
MQRRVLYKYVDGCCVNAIFPDDIVRSALNYKPRPDDVFIATYPKCGTTWVQFIVHGILNRGSFPENSLEFMLASPFLEMLGAEAVLRMPRPGTIKTHMPFGKAPYSKEAKYITVTRNPFDVCVSFYYHTKERPSYGADQLTFEEYFDNFVRGQVSFGDYFDHLLSWYEHRRYPNVLFLTYEDLKKDLRAQILKIADFLGSEYGTLLREDEGLLAKLQEGTQFTKMQATIDSGGSVLIQLLNLPPERALPSLEPYRAVLEKTSAAKNHGRFLRKGVVGDWRNHFTEAQVNKMKERIAEKCGHTDVMKLWEGLDLPLP